MIKADLPELETLAVLASRAASLAGELHYQIRSVITEMHDDPVFMENPGYTPVSNALDRACEATASAEAVLPYLAGILGNVSGEYTDMERESSEKVRGMLSLFEEGMMNFSSAMDPSLVTVPENCSDTDGAGRVSEIFTGGSDLPETVNISLVRETVESEYLVKDGE